MTAVTPEHLAAVADGAMSVKQAMAFTGDSRARLFQLMDAGVLVWFPVSDSPRAQRRITRASLVAYMAQMLAGNAPRRIA
jgi:hypothetical protein